MIALLFPYDASASPTPQPGSQNTNQTSQRGHEIQPTPTPIPPRRVEIERGEITEKNEQQPVRVIVAPVTVSKGLSDYIGMLLPAIFSGFLVVVGALQVWLLKQTNSIYAAQKEILWQQTLLANRPHIFIRQLTLRNELNNLRERTPGSRICSRK